MLVHETIPVEAILSSCVRRIDTRGNEKVALGQAHRFHFFVVQHATQGDQAVSAALGDAADHQLP